MYNKIVNKNQKGNASLVFVLIIVALIGIASLYVYQNNPFERGNGQPQPASSSKKPHKLPLMKISYGRKIYDGVEGSYCWTEKIQGDMETKVCKDKGLIDPPNIIPVVSGDTLTVTIDAYEKPTKLNASIFKESVVEAYSHISLTPALTTTFPANFPSGTYIINISGFWSGGSVSYTFKIEVE